MEKQKVVVFLKKFGYYIVAGLLLIAIGVTLMVATNNLETIPEDENIIDVGSQPITFALPMSEFSVLGAYTDTELLYNKTLNVWQAHKYYQIASENLDVFAIADGVVTAVQDDYALGFCVTITHKDGYKSFYASLADVLEVSLGDNVQKGQLLGQASISAANESEEGPHLHFELFKDNAKVNPSTVLNLEGK